MAAAKKLEASHEVEEQTTSEDHDDLEMHLRPSKKSEDSEGVWLVSYADLMTLLMGFFALIASFSKVDATEFEKVKQEAVKYFGGEYENPYGDLAQSLTSAIKNMGLDEQVTVEAKAEGVVITFEGTLLFDSGDFKLKDSGRDIMNQISKAVHHEAPSHKILIEGHTDNAPISQDIIASNWELSSLRASRVAQLFERHGYKKNQITLMGWGETKPLVPNENSDGSTNHGNRAKNRRVVITVQN